VANTSASHAVEASQDIVAGNGIKLVAKGARIDPAMRERLLQHKLLKPIEDCMQVTGGMTAERIASIAAQLLEQHALLAAVCSSDAPLSVPESLAQLQLSAPVQSLLTVYSQYQAGRVEHMIGVAMLSLALARKLLPGEIVRQRTLALAGLLHDIGELYLDPKHLRRDSVLEPIQWRHIVTHPLVGQRVLQNMEGAGPAVAQAVLLHHERMDGFGYPHGIQGDRLPLDGQIIGASEWLMALIESGRTPLARASVATKLIPGEFRTELLEAIVAAARSSDKMQAEIAAPRPLEDALPRILFLIGISQRFMQTRGWIEARIGQAKGECRRVLETGLQRMLRIQTAFNSTGLNVADPQPLLHELAALHDPQVHLEVVTIVRELEWRVQEVARECLLRGALMSPAENSVMCELVARVKGQAG
jgi:hypothetical protein